MELRWRSVERRCGPGFRRPRLGVQREDVAHVRRDRVDERRTAGAVSVAHERTEYRKSARSFGIFHVSILSWRTIERGRRRRARADLGEQPARSVRPGPRRRCGPRRRSPQGKARGRARTTPRRPCAGPTPPCRCRNTMDRGARILRVLGGSGASWTRSRAPPRAKGGLGAVTAPRRLHETPTGRRRSCSRGRARATVVAAEALATPIAPVSPPATSLSTSATPAGCAR